MLCPAMRFCGEPVSFNLELADSIEQFLSEESTWRGVGGNWIITFGEESSAIEGTDVSLPTASGAVNDFSRIWFGSASAEAVSVTGTFVADPELIQRIDSIVKLPVPTVDWDF